MIDKIFELAALAAMVSGKDGAAPASTKAPSMGDLVNRARETINDPMQPDLSKPPPARALTRGVPFSWPISLTLPQRDAPGGEPATINLSGYGFQIIPGTLSGSSNPSALYRPGAVLPEWLYPLTVQITAMESGTVETVTVSDSSYFPVPYGFTKLVVQSAVVPDFSDGNIQSVLEGATGSFFVNIIPDREHDLSPGPRGINYRNGLSAVQGGVGAVYFDFDCSKDGAYSNNGLDAIQTAGADNSPTQPTAGVNLDGVSAARILGRCLQAGQTFDGSGSILYFLYNGQLGVWHTYKEVPMTALAGRSTFAFVEELFTCKRTGDRFYAAAINVGTTGGNLGIHHQAVRF
jgi:hypothetical protein